MKRDKLSLTTEEMRELGYRAVDILVEHFATLRDKPVTRKADRAHMESLFREPLPEHGMPPLDVLKRVERDIFGHTMHVDHPRFFAFVPSPSNFVSAVADALCSGFNVFAGTWLEASAPAEVELVTLDWLRQLFGLPDSAGGLFTSGGSVANLTGLALARHIKLANSVEGAVIYCSDQTHSSIDRAVRVLGFAPDQLLRLPSNDEFQLDLPSVSRAIAADRAAGRNPFCVVANAGTTNTGAVDSLPELATLCAREGLWLHCDGAFGAAAIFCTRGRALLDGIERVDSLSLDPHKWLFQPFEIGCLLVRQMAGLKEAFHVMPEYLKDTEGLPDEVNFCDFGIQLTRSFRALKLWMSLQVFGRAGFERAVLHGFELADLAAQVLDDMADWEVVTAPRLGVLTFRCRPASVPSNAVDHLNRALVDAIQDDGFTMIVSTELRGRPVLRMCPINPRTTEEDIRATFERLDRLQQDLATSRFRDLG